jgi:hypothetical protein
MKTLGQILHDAEHEGDGDYFNYDDLSEGVKARWESVAQKVATTVRAETLEEAAKICEERSNWLPAACAAAIRSLALEPKK